MCGSNHARFGRAVAALIAVALGLQSAGCQQAKRTPQPASTGQQSAGAPSATGDISASDAEEPVVVVNAQRLTPDQIAGLERIVHMPVMPGTYWYDNVSGAWGFDGQPLAGFLPAGLKLGGPLRADASHGTTGVFINGRQLHVLDVMRLQQWLGTPVMQGRYWVDARGTFGYEGGPPLGNLVAIAQQNSVRLGRQGNTITECSSNGCGSGNSNTGLGVITDGEGHGAVFSDGHVISTP